MQSSNNISLTAEITILPGFDEEILAAAENVWIVTRKENGCEAFLFHTKRDLPHVIVFVEVFKTQADFDAHIAFEHTITFLNILKGKVVGDAPVLTFLNQYKD